MVFSQQQWQQLLSPRLPEGFASPVASLIGSRHLEIRITRPRATKFGDYRPPYRKTFHRISINNDLNPYGFLVTLVHELAHLYVWEQYKTRVKPHGSAWKNTFKTLMDTVTADLVLPDDIEQELNRYLNNPAASSCSDVQLYKTLRRYDPPSEFQLLEELFDGARFELSNGRQFIREQKLRSRYRCNSLDNGRIYLVSGIASVRLLAGR